MSDLAARVWAKQLYGSDTLYKDLACGDQFRFPGFEEAYVKCGRTSYKSLDGRRRFTTGVRAVVHRVAP